MTTASAERRLSLARRALAPALFGLSTLASALAAYPAMFRRFSDWDDEGFLLISFKEFVSHGQLYDQVFTQYGPFHYEFIGGLFSLGLDVSHDSGRFITLGFWLATSLICGVATRRLTGSLALGLTAQLLVFRVLDHLRLEPLHPGGLICLLLSCLLGALLLYPRRPRAAMFLVGATVTAVALSKINVGVFAGISLAFAFVGAFPALVRRRWAWPLAAGLFVAAPVLLMARDLDQGWVQGYALHVGVAALAIAITVGGRLPGPLGRLQGFPWLLAGAGAMTAVVLVIVLLTGTSLTGLVEGVFIDPLSQPGAFSAQLALPSWFLAWDALALAACVAYRRRELPPLLTGGFRLLAGLAVLASLAGVGLQYLLPLPELSMPLARQGNTLQAALALSLPLAWVAVSAPRRGPAAEPSLARIALPALAVLQALHAYPVAGSQLAFAAFLLVPVGCVCVSDGLAELRDWAPASGRESIVGKLRVAVPAGLAIVSAWAALVGPLRFEWRRYDDSVALALSGSSRIRLDEWEARRYQRVTGWIAARCSTFVTLPGLNSLYLWSRKEPPTRLNATGWMYLLSPAMQREVVTAAGSKERLCAVRNRRLVSFWAGGRRVPSGPLLAFISREFTPVKRYGGFELLVRRAGQRASR